MEKKVLLQLTEAEIDALINLVDYASGDISTDDEPLLLDVIELLSNAKDSIANQ